jgi:hypothetical protein
MFAERPERVCWQARREASPEMMLAERPERANREPAARRGPS